MEGSPRQKNQRELLDKNFMLDSLPMEGFHMETFALNK